MHVCRQGGLVGVFLCAVLVLPSASRQLDGAFVRVEDGGNHVEWAGLEARTSSQVSFSPVIESGSLLHHHLHHHSPLPPSPPLLSPLPPSPPPPPPPPPISLNTFDVVKGFLVPRFDPAVHLYKTTMGESVSEVRVAVSVPSNIQVQTQFNSSKLITGQQSQPIPIGANGETLDLVITISAPGLSNNSYYLSAHRVERSSIWGRIVKRSLLGAFHCCFC